MLFALYRYMFYSLLLTVFLELNLPGNYIKYYVFEHFKTKPNKLRLQYKENIFNCIY